MYEITDRDWAKSPASSTIYGTYNSVENKIYNHMSMLYISIETSTIKQERGVTMIKMLGA